MPADHPSESSVTIEICGTPNTYTTHALTEPRADSMGTEVSAIAVDVVAAGRGGVDGANNPRRRARSSPSEGKSDWEVDGFVADSPERSVPGGVSSVGAV